MNEIFEMAGMNLPEFLGKKMDGTAADGAVVAAVDAKDVAADAKEVKAVEAPKAEAAPVEEAVAEAAPAAPETVPGAPDPTKPIWEA